MHQLAIALKRKGYQITGSDDEIFEPARTNLKTEGLLPEFTGWFPEKLGNDLDSVILGMHAKADNPELLKAKELGLPVFSFPEYIFRESGEKKRIVVGGSHGKTTTTAMIMHILRETGRNFDYLVGARLQGFDQSVKITDAPVIVCEGDEYPASIVEKRPKFHFLYPHVAVLTGIAWDHINVFPTFDFYLEQFTIFINKIEKGGHLVYNNTDPVLADLVASCKRDDISYHPYGPLDHSITNGITRISLDGRETELKVFGEHNLLNMHAAWIVCKQLGVGQDEFLTAASSFSGASKRLEQLAKNHSTIIYRDFAHAPSKVKATMNAVHQQYPERKIIGVLELHTFSSLNQEFMKEYQGVMDPADKSAVFYSRHALELKRMPDLPEEAVISGFAGSSLEVFNDRRKLEDWLNAQDFENAVLVLMSSGNYDGMDLEALTKGIIKAAD
jgi:UDP-N-acetylmuramate: L-alanyl-gamma-D-glutamyl-meso-diaminopimelate ligase